VRRSGRTAKVSVVLGLAGLAVAVGVTAASAQEAQYVALGDSYSAGVGAGDYDPDSGDCNRSTAAYPELVADAIGAELTFVACTEAVVPDVAEQLDSLSEDTAYVTVSVGGNDAGFEAVVTQCAKPWPTTCWGDIDDSAAFIQDELPGSLDELYTEIETRAPNAEVVVVGYPRLFNGEECNLASRISAGEQEELNATGDKLADVISFVAVGHGFEFVDPRDAFAGHAVCDDDEWINGLSRPIWESYHPNADGYAEGYAPLVQAAIEGS
jgi:lysophospholipase L1-like esterase